MNMDCPKWLDEMDKLDRQLINALRKDGRASLSTLAATLRVTRATVRARLERLQNRGEITGFTVLTRADVAPQPVRGLMMLAIEGRGKNKVERALRRMPQVAVMHSTNGTWDMIAEIGTETLQDFDQVLSEIREIDVITRSETNLLLSTTR